MKVGDIVYFKSICVSKYGMPGGSYSYYFKPGDRYQIIDFYHNGQSPITGTIINLEDGEKHFAHSKHWDLIIDVEQWRELQLEKLI